MNISTSAFPAMRTALRQVDMTKVGSTINVARNIAGNKVLQVKNSLLEQHKAGPNDFTSKILSIVMDTFQSGRGARDVEHSHSGGSFRMDGAAHGADKVNYEREAANPTVMSFLSIIDKAGKVLLSLGKSVAKAFAAAAAAPPKDPVAARQARNASFASRSSLSSTLRDIATEGFKKARTQQGTTMPTPPGMPPQPAYIPSNCAPPPNGPPPRADNFTRTAQEARANAFSDLLPFASHARATAEAYGRAKPRLANLAHRLKLDLQADLPLRTGAQGGFLEQLTVLTQARTATSQQYDEAFGVDFQRLSNDGKTTRQKNNCFFISAQQISAMASGKRPPLIHDADVIESFRIAREDGEEEPDQMVLASGTLAKRFVDNLNLGKPPNEQVRIHVIQVLPGHVLDEIQGSKHPDAKEGFILDMGGHFEALAVKPLDV
ncbi:hypothetical protein [Pseudomonas savastanoi]|uniref:hypothetical protein n=1 Tax=Pseudomonas savastanoi TaxID=29438 RepID=UPI00117B810B|nr:hypothetical protein [Pseudomonas savastanoi]